MLRRANILEGSVRFPEVWFSSFPDSGCITDLTLKKKSCVGRKCGTVG